MAEVGLELKQYDSRTYALKYINIPFVDFMAAE